MTGASGPALTPEETAQLLGDPRLFALTRAQKLLGNTMNAVLGGHFEGSGEFTTAGAAGTGAAALRVDATAGVLRATSGAGAGGLISALPPGGGSLISNPAADRFYASFRAAWPTATNNQAQQTVNLFAPNGGNPQILFGVGAAPLSAANFSYWVIGNAGATAASGATGTALDAAYHWIEFTGDGTNLRIYLDFVLIATVSVGVANFPSLPLTWGITAYNGATAAARQVDLDQRWVVVPGN